ncbi:MAG: epoxyqueuosine reductase, partial [Planctomycetota bacterium]
MAFLNTQIKAKLIKEGASLVGFADVRGLPADVRCSMDFGISIAVALDASIINDISEGPTKSYFEEYERANEFLSGLCGVVVDELRRRGRDAK